MKPGEAGEVKDPRSGDGERGLPPTIEYRAVEHPGVRLLTIARPEKMNAIGPDEARGLDLALHLFREDPDARVLVLTGAGSDAFSAGADLQAVAATAGVGEGRPLFPIEDPGDPRSPEIGNIGPTRQHDLYKPVIAAINGAAYAGGLEWACFAHLRVADRHASFGVTCRRWNVGLGDGGTQRLPRIVGLGRALDLILTGRVIGATEAERIGLVNEVTPSGRCLERALGIAALLSGLPQGAMRTDLEATMRGTGLPLDRGLEVERECFDRLLKDPDLARGATRFLERDHPDLVGGSPALHPPARAWSVARDAHAGQVDRFGREFIRHPAGVAELCTDLEDEDALVAAYLHDTIEKTDLSAGEIGTLFGRRVERAVIALSQDPSISDSAERRIEHRSRIATAEPFVIDVYANDRREGIREFLGRVEEGADPEVFGGRKRLEAWQGDLESLRSTAVDPRILVALEGELEALSALVDSAFRV